MKKFFKIFFLSIGVLLLVFVGYFFLIKNLDSNALNERQLATTPYSGQPTLLPSKFLNGERFYIKMASVNGDTVLAFGDSGGGVSMAIPYALDKLELQQQVKWALLKGVVPMRYIPFKAMVKDKNIPLPLQPCGMILRRFLSQVQGPYLLVIPVDDDTKFLGKTMGVDIFLGQNFFMGKAWTFDYLRQQVWANTPVSPAEEGMPNVQRLGFKKDANNKKLFGHARMYMVVDGEVIEVLFDTGATIILSGYGKKVFKTTQPTIGGSFIAASVFDKWRKLHPGWKCYKKADMQQDVIEVPVVTLGGCDVGPVLFAKRPDEAWSEGMISTMDSLVKGAIGGSALKYLKVAVDYNTELIKFEK